MHLYSHIFRGMPADQPIPYYLLDAASMAVSAATSILDFIRSDSDIGASIIGIPSYLHSMTAFACMFLIKVAVKYGSDLIDKSRVHEMITALVQHFRSLPAGKWHLANLMAGGLEKMAATLLDPAADARFQQQNASSGIGNDVTNAAAATGLASLANGVIPGDTHFDGAGPGGNLFADLAGDTFFDYGMSFGLSPVFAFGSSTFGLDAAGQGSEDFSELAYHQMGPSS
jgi:hypothetical protein